LTFFLLIAFFFPKIGPVWTMNNESGNAGYVSDELILQAQSRDFEGQGGGGPQRPRSYSFQEKYHRYGSKR